MIFNGYSRPINRGLFTIFMLCQIAEQSGHGIPTIVKKYGKEAFDFRGSAIKVTIKYAFNLINTEDGVVENDGDVDVNVPVNGTVNGTVKLSKNEIKVYELLKKDNNINIEQIVATSKISRRTVIRVLNNLKDHNIIKRVGSDKTGHWEIC